MTEYDYSPGAVERYQEKLRSIGRWAEETSHHRPANPYLPTTPAMHVANLQADRQYPNSRKSSSSSSREKHRSRSVDQGSNRPNKPTRSNTYGSSSYPLRPGLQPHTGAGTGYSSPRYPTPPTTYQNPRKDITRSHGPSMSTSSLPHAHPQPRRSNTMPHQPAPPPVPAPVPPPAPMPYRQQPVRSNTTGHNTATAAYANLYYPPYKEAVVIPAGGYAVLPGGMVQTPVMAHSPVSPVQAPTPTKSWLSKLTGGILGSKSPPPSPSPSQQQYYMPAADVTRSKSHKHKSSRSRSSKRHGHRQGRSGERRYSY